MLTGAPVEDHSTYGVNTFSDDITDESELNAELAEKIVSFWYKKGINYNYLDEPSNNDAGKLIAPHRMFIIMFSKLLVNYYNNYTSHPIYIFEYRFSI